MSGEIRISSPMMSPESYLNANNYFDEVDSSSSRPMSGEIVGSARTPPERNLDANNFFHVFDYGSSRPLSGANVQDTDSSCDNSSVRRNTKKHRKLKKKKTRKQRRERRSYQEGLQRIRDTLILAATLISTFTFSAGINPPGGVHQDGNLIGTAVAAKKTAFRIFSVCNNIALFTSLCIVIVLMSIVPYKNKVLLRILEIAHKVMWMAISFMAVAYVAAGVVILQPPTPGHRSRLDWPVIVLISISAGSLVSIFVALSVLLIGKIVMKRTMRKKAEMITHPPTDNLFNGLISCSLLQDELKISCK